MNPPLFDPIFCTSELSSHGGLVFVRNVVEATGLLHAVDQRQARVSQYPRKIPDRDIIYSLIALCSMGKPHFESIERYRENRFFHLHSGAEKIPSPSSLRLRLERMTEEDDPENREKHDPPHETMHALIVQSQQKLVSSMTPRITGVSTQVGECIPLDLDVTIFNNEPSKKEGVELTYQKIKGYAPLLAYMGLEGYILKGDLRPGNWHSQKGTPAFLETCLKQSASWLKHPILLRADAGFDAAENRAICRKYNAFYIIKRNLRKIPDDTFLGIAESYGNLVDQTRDYRCYVGGFYKPGDTHEERVVYHLTCWDRDPKTQQRFLDPKLSLSAFWTNLPDPPKAIIELYNMRGAGETFHRELKSDLQLERLPSGKFKTNSLLFQIGLLSYNVLRLIGAVYHLVSHRQNPFDGRIPTDLSTLLESASRPQVDPPDPLQRAESNSSPAYPKAGPPAQKDARPRAPLRRRIRRTARRISVRTVMQDIIQVAVQLACHGRRWMLKIGPKTPWRQAWIKFFHCFTSYLSSLQSRASPSMSVP